MGNKKINFYSQWTDEELKNVIIPLMGKLGMPELPIEDLRWFDKKDSESIFMSQSLSKDTIEAKFNMATAYYSLQKKHGVEYNREAFVQKIWENWSNLKNLFDKNKTDTKEKQIKADLLNHEIDNNVIKPENNEKQTSLFDKFTNYLYKGKHEKKNTETIDPNIASMYGIDNPDNSKKQKDVEIPYDMYGGRDR